MKSISFRLCSFKNLFVLENGLLPKKPELHENGDGWVASNTRCFGLVIRLFLLLAKLPHRINTTGVSFSFIFLMIASVKFSQPKFLWEAGLSFSTVKTEFNSNTPSLAQHDKSPLSDISIFRSLFNSLYIFFSEGGSFIPLLTAKANPFASPTPWYGSWPNITTFTSS